MGKRGQIYILAAILLAVVVYGLSTVVNVVQQEEIPGDFEAVRTASMVLGTGEQRLFVMELFLSVRLSEAKPRSPFAERGEQPQPCTADTRICSTPS